MKIEEESGDRVNKTIKATDRRSTGEGEPAPVAGMGIRPPVLLLLPP